MPGPLLNSAAVIQCAHGGVFVPIPKGERPLIGGAPAVAASDLPGTVAAGCVWNILGVPTPCVIVSVLSGMTPNILVGGTPAVDVTLECITSNGLPTLPVSSAGQAVVMSA